MAVKPLKKAKYSKNKRKEKESLYVLDHLLPASVASQFTGGDDNFPLIDGYLHLLGEDSEMSGKTLQIQVKQLSHAKKGIYSTCKPTLFAHAQDSTVPVLLIGVDVSKSEAYWRYLSPEFINEYINDRSTIPKDTVTVYFSKSNKITADDKCSAEWHKVSNHHRNTSNDKTVLRFIKKLTKTRLRHCLGVSELETLSDFAFYRTNRGTYPVVDLILGSALQIYENDKELKLTYLKTLNIILYHRPKEVLEIVSHFLKDAEEEVQNEAKKILLEASKYNIHVLQNIGLSPYRAILDFIPSLLEYEIPFSKTLALELLGNILNPTFEGTSYPSLNTLTIHHGPLHYTLYLKKMRNDAIELLCELVDKGTSLSIRVSALDTLSRALFMSEWPFNDPKLQKKAEVMIEENAQVVVGKYADVVRKHMDIYPMIHEIESKLVLLKIRETKINGLTELLEKIRTTRTDYKLYRLLAGGDETRIRLDTDYTVIQQEKQEAVKDCISKITDKNLLTWVSRFEKIAKYRPEKDDDWRFQTFRDFLFRFASEKPDLAVKVLGKIFKEKSHLHPFAGSLIMGLRVSSLKSWDLFVSKIQAAKSIELVGDLLRSFEFEDYSKKKLRKSDINIIEDISKAQGKFRFLPDDNIFLHYQIMRTLVWVYRTNPSYFKKLILERLSKYDKGRFQYYSLEQLDMGFFREVFDFSEWSKEDLNALAENLVRAESLHHHETSMLHKIGQADFPTLMKIIERRLKREAKEPGGTYSSIPNHGSMELYSFIANHSRYATFLRKWVASVSENKNLFTMDLGRFIYEVGGTTLATVLSEMVESGEEENLKKVIALFPTIEAPDIELCFKIISVTDNREIWERVEGQMYNTGGLSGAYGENLYGNALRQLKQRIESELKVTKSKRVLIFCKEAITNLEESINRSDESHKRDLEADLEEFAEGKELEE